MDDESSRDAARMPRLERRDVQRRGAWDWKAVPSQRGEMADCDIATDTGESRQLVYGRVIGVPGPCVRSREHGHEVTQTNLVVYASPADATYQFPSRRDATVTGENLINSCSHSRRMANRTCSATQRPNGGGYE